MKTVIAIVIVTAILQFAICQRPFLEYSGKVYFTLMLIGMLGWIALGFNAPNKNMAYWGSVALGIPSISYSMVGYGVLEMGGFLHTFCFGLYGFICYLIIQRFKAWRQKCTSKTCNFDS